MYKRQLYERFRDGKLIDSQLEVMRYRLWGLWEFEMLLKEAGFVDINVCANLTPGRKPTAGARALNFEAAKPG